LLLFASDNIAVHVLSSLKNVFSVYYSLAIQCAVVTINPELIFLFKYY